MTTAHLAELRRIVVRRLGFSLDASRDVELAEVVARRLGELGRPSVDAYIEALDADNTTDGEIQALGQLLSVGETYFFRAREHFDVLRDVALPSRPRHRGDDLHILSAGCSSGEEPYSLAIFMREYERSTRPATWLRWHVAAMDLSRGALDRAQSGVYSTWSLRNTPPELRDRWFVTRGREYEVRSEIRSNVTFEVRNLLDERSLTVGRGSFDVVFCRNVLMYFTPEAARAVVTKLAAALAPGGVLFLGHAESLRGVSDAFTVESSHGTFYYRLERQPTVARPAPRVEEAVTPREPVAPVLAAPLPTLTRTAMTLEAIRELVALDHFERALEALGLLPAAEQAKTSAEIVRAVARLGAGDLEAAKAACARVLALDEANSEAHVVLAIVAEHRGDASAAIEHHRAAIYLEPNFAVPHLHLGRLQRRAGKVDEARHALGQALDLLEREEPSRLLLFGGGFGREGLRALCRTELATLGGPRS